MNSNITDLVSGWSHYHRNAPRMSVAVCAVTRREDQVLLVRQSYGRFKDQWVIPAGMAEIGEAYDITIVRELHEEANIVATAEGIMGIAFVDWEGDVQLVLTFLCHHVSGEPKPDGRECHDARYFDISELDLLGDTLEELSGELCRRVLSGDFQLLQDVGSVSPITSKSFV